MSILDIMTITNYEQFGYLMQSYALGVDLVHKPPIPTDDARYKVGVGPITRTKLEQDMNDAGVGATIPVRYTTIQLVQSTNDTLIIKLPEAAPLQTTLNSLNVPSTAWGLPQFYVDANGFKATNPAPSMPPDQKQRLFADRIGDYTMSVCL